jgi:hypothetical protein
MDERIWRTFWRSGVSRRRRVTIPSPLILVGCVFKTMKLGAMLFE